MVDKGKDVKEEKEDILESVDEEGSSNTNNVDGGDTGSNVEKTAVVGYKKKFVRKRKVSEKVDPLEKELKLAVETGEIVFGYRESLSSVNSKKAKGVIISSNARNDVLHNISERCNHLNIPYAVVSKGSMQLGTICGKPYPVSVISISNGGTSNILDMIIGLSKKDAHGSNKGLDKSE